MNNRIGLDSARLARIQLQSPEAPAAKATANAPVSVPAKLDQLAPARPPPARAAPTAVTVPPNEAQSPPSAAAATQAVVEANGALAASHAEFQAARTVVEAFVEARGAEDPATRMEHARALEAKDALAEARTKAELAEAQLDRCFATEWKDIPRTRAEEIRARLEHIDGEIGRLKGELNEVKGAQKKVEYYLEGLLRQAEEGTTPELEEQIAPLDGVLQRAQGATTPDLEGKIASARAELTKLYQLNERISYDIVNLLSEKAALQRELKNLEGPPPATTQSPGPLNGALEAADSERATARRAITTKVKGGKVAELPFLRTRLVAAEATLYMLKHLERVPH